MSLTGGDPWLKDYDRLDRLANEVQADINERNRLLRGNVNNTQKISTSIRRKLNQLNTEITTLEEDLMRMSEQPAAWHITKNEIHRREDMLNNLANRRNQLEHASKAIAQATNADRDELFSGGSKAKSSGFGGRSRNIWGAPAETDETRELSNYDVVGLQKKKIQDQDRDLEALGETIGRQKDIAVAINEELDVHTGLLDDLDGHVSSTTHRVRGETERVMSFSEKVKTGGMLCTIVILVIVCIVLLAIPG
mmetsp:Transcript_16502/g.24629  ORF Transcript_16502/g.24629 Transcript_16502/m.24629 type:complete len:251 (+) Transcript_16502:54-806(+)